LIVTLLWEKKARLASIAIPLLDIFRVKARRYGSVSPNMTFFFAGNRLERRLFLIIVCCRSTRPIYFKETELILALGYLFQIVNEFFLCIDSLALLHEFVLTLVGTQEMISPADYAGSN
jgi:hypothetical protein